MVSESDAFRCPFVAQNLGVSLCWYACMVLFLLWCVLPQRLSRWARAVKAPVRFPLCAWLHCRTEDSLQEPGCSECAPLARLPGFKTRKRRALPEGAVVRFCGARVGGRGFGGVA